MLITANRLRIKDLKRRLAELNKQRERERKKNMPRRANYFSDDDDDEEEEDRHNNNVIDHTDEQTTITHDTHDDKVNDILRDDQHSAEFSAERCEHDSKTVETDATNDIEKIKDYSSNTVDINSATYGCISTNHSEHATVDQG